MLIPSTNERNESRNANYFYKDGKLPAGTEYFFNSYSILTILGVIKFITFVLLKIFLILIEILEVSGKDGGS